MTYIDDTIFARIWEHYERTEKIFPNEDEAFLWLDAEIGELAEAKVVSAGKPWVRNNPDKSQHTVAEEIGDVLMMLYVFARATGINPYEAMLAKMAAKEERSGGSE